MGVRMWESMVPLTAVCPKRRDILRKKHKRLTSGLATGVIAASSCNLIGYGRGDSPGSAGPPERFNEIGVEF